MGHSKTGRKWGAIITVITYQSKRVLKIVQSGKVYRAHRNIGMDRAYSALVEILGLHCECPIFGCLRFRRQCTNGKVSSSAKLVLKVPDECVKLTEYSVWADFMYHIQYTKPADYTMVAVDSVEQLSQAQLDKMIHSLKKQRRPLAYHCPQAILEEIRPEWLVDFSLHNKESFWQRRKR